MGSGRKAIQLPSSTDGYTSGDQNAHAYHQQHRPAAKLKAYGPALCTGNGQTTTVGVVAEDTTVLRLSTWQSLVVKRPRNYNLGEKETHNIGQIILAHTMGYII